MGKFRGHPFAMQRKRTSGHLSGVTLRAEMLAEAGHQSGAHEAASKTNITLTTLVELATAAKSELLALSLVEVGRRATKIKNDIHNLYDHIRHDKGSGFWMTSKPKLGVDGRRATKVGGLAAIIAIGAEQAQFGSFPVPLTTDDDGQKIVRAKDL